MSNILQVLKSELPEENYSAPHQIKAFYVSGTYISNGGIQEYTDI